MIEISIGVDSGLEVHAVQLEVAPPVPGREAGFDPGYVFYAGRAGKLVYHIVHRQVAVGGAVGDYAPGIGAGGICVAKVIQIFAVGDRGVFGIGRKFRLEAFFSGFQEHSGIVPDVRFHKQQTAIVAKVYVDWHKCQPAPGNFFVAAGHCFVRAFK